MIALDQHMLFSTKETCIAYWLVISALFEVDKYQQLFAKCRLLDID